MTGASLSMSRTTDEILEPAIAIRTGAIARTGIQAHAEVHEADYTRGPSAAVLFQLRLTALPTSASSVLTFTLDETPNPVVLMQL